MLSDVKNVPQKPFPSTLFPFCDQLSHQQMFSKIICIPTMSKVHWYVILTHTPSVFMCVPIKKILG